jgi:hypothetical protein
MSDLQTHILDIRDTPYGVTEQGIDEFNIRAYLTQAGFRVTNVAAKASGHVFVTCTGLEIDVEKAWLEYDPSKVNPASLLSQQVLSLKGTLEQLRAGRATDKQKDEALATIIELALKSYGVSG